MSFERYVSIVDSTADMMQQVMPCRVARLRAPQAGWMVRAPGGGVGALTATPHENGTTDFLSMGLVGTGFRDGPGLLRTLTGATAISFGGAFTVEVAHGQLALGYFARMQSWMTDPNPADGAQQLLVAAMAQADFAAQVAPRLLSLCPTADLAVADVDEIAHVLSCVLIEKMHWSLGGGE